MNKSFFLTNDNYIGYVSLHILVNVTGHNLPSAVINLVSFERKKSRPIAQLWATSILLIVLMHLSLSLYGHHLWPGGYKVDGYSLIFPPLLRLFFCAGN